MHFSIEINEKARNPDVLQNELDELMTLSISKTDSKMDQQKEDFLFNILQSEGADKAITNLSEYLLMTETLSGNIKVSLLNSIVKKYIEFLVLV